MRGINLVKKVKPNVYSGPNKGSGKPTPAPKQQPVPQNKAITRGDTNKKQLALVFTGDEFGDGGNAIATHCNRKACKASFFLNGPLLPGTSFQGNH